MKLKRYFKNPILKPIKENPWEEKAVFNPAAIYLNKKIHLIYRAMSKDNVSSLGYARFSSDGYTLEERLNYPIYYPKEIFEKRTKKKGKGKYGNVGSEDPRITLIGDKIYMCYTAVDDVHETKIALTSIKKDDFLNKNWKFKKPILISPPGIGDRNGCLIQFKKGFAFFHRIYPGIWIDIRKNLEFKKGEWILGKLWIKPREGFWDSRKVGIAGPPLKIKEGFLLIYHGVSEKDKFYRLGAAILDKNDPRKVLYRSRDPILEPEKNYEIFGQVPNVVFSCGAVIIGNKLFLYYGGADNVIGLATANLNKLIKSLKK